MSDDVVKEPVIAKDDGQWHMVITIYAKKVKRYQVLWRWMGEVIEACIDNYFSQSERVTAVSLSAQVWMENWQVQVMLIQNLTCEL